MNAVRMKLLVAVCTVVAVPASVVADEEVVISPPPEGSVDREQGLEAWSRIYDVASHPRCANCHVGADNLPMWSGPSYGETRPHGMFIDGGISRIGGLYACRLRRSRVADLQIERSFRKRNLIRVAIGTSRTSKGNHAAT